MSPRRDPATALYWPAGRGLFHARRAARHRWWALAGALAATTAIALWL